MSVLTLRPSGAASTTSSARTVSPTPRVCSRGISAKKASDYEPIEFKSEFRYYLLIPEDPGAKPTGTEEILAAAKDSKTARFMLNALYADGHQVSGWSNEQGGWFMTPEITQAFENMMRNAVPQ